MIAIQWKTKSTNVACILMAQINNTGKNPPRTTSLISQRQYQKKFDLLLIRVIDTVTAVR